MHEPADDRLHDWVRQQIQDYEAPDNPRPDWRRVRRSLRSGQWIRLSAWLGLTGVVSLIVWLLWPTYESDMITQPKTRLQRPPNPELSLSQPLINKQEENTTLGWQRKKATGLNAEQNQFLPVVSEERRVWLPISERSFVGAVRPLSVSLANLTVPVPGVDEWVIRQQVIAGQVLGDSIAYRALCRNESRWTDAVIVCDMTSSMYPYTTQLMAWFNRQNNQRKTHPRIQGVIFFTDCDTAGRETQDNGPPGQFFATKHLTPEAMLPTLLQAAQNTLGNRLPAENDLEALLFAQRQFPQAKQFILLADNDSPVKGMEKLSELVKPVRVILLGTPADSTRPFQPDYGQIALQSGGSLHAIDDDLDPGRPEQTPVLRVGNRYYRYIERRKTYRLTRFDHRPARLLGPVWW